MVEYILIGLAVTFLGLLAIGVYSGKVELRPFRTSAIAFGLMLIGLVWLGLNHDFKLLGAVTKETEQIINAVIDVSVFMVAVTGLVTALTKLSDDPGDSEAIKIARLILEDKESK